MKRYEMRELSLQEIVFTILHTKSCICKGAGLFLRTVVHPRGTAAAVAAKNMPQACFINAATDSQRDSFHYTAYKVLHLQRCRAFCERWFILAAQPLRSQLKTCRRHVLLTPQQILKEIISLSLTRAHIRMVVGFLCAKKRLMLWFWSLFGLYSC